MPLLVRFGSYVLPVGATGNDSADLWNQVYRDLDTVLGPRRPAVESLFVSLNDPSVPLESQVRTLDEIIGRLQN
jgi:hypothetical protein